MIRLKAVSRWRTNCTNATSTPKSGVAKSTRIPVSSKAEPEPPMKSGRTRLSVTTCVATFFPWRATRIKPRIMIAMLARRPKNSVRLMPIDVGLSACATASVWGAVLLANANHSQRHLDGVDDQNHRECVAQSALADASQDTRADRGANEDPDRHRDGERRIDQ